MSEKGSRFEEDVLAIARVLWPDEEGGSINLRGREVDGVFKTSDAIFVIECTVERTKKKAEKDIGKLEKNVAYLRRGHKSHVVKGFFITANEPTADQREVLEKCNEVIVALSFSEFRKKLVDAEGYLNKRINAPFGSMRDPKTESSTIKHKYIPSTMLDSTGRDRDHVNLQQDIKSGRNVVLLGEYGAGKSTTIYEIFRRLRKDFVDGNHKRFPVVINLRDHLGQSDPVEVLERHARNVGYDRPHDLVSAWRSGYADLIFDGFDEVANQGWISSAKRLSEIRFRSMEVLRRFVNETPGGAGLLFAGRTNYFDSEFELKTALNLKGRALVYRLLEFSTDEVKEFLNGLGWKKPIPDWMPTRPLLLGYLVAQELLEEIDPTSSLSPAAGWHALLDKISEREAQLEPGIQSGDIRRLLENVAVIARAREDGLGPVTASEIREAFVATCGLEPDDKATVLLGRLPGLGASQTEDGSRVFIDKDFANSAAGSALARFFQHPYDKDWKKKEWMQSLSPLGIEVALELFLDLGLSEGNVTSVEDELLSGGHYNMTLLADVVLFSGYSDYRIGHDVVVEGVFFPEISSTQFEGDLSRVTLDGGVVQFLELPERAGWSHLPKFQNCDIGKISGCTKKSELPNSKFDDECSVEKFDDSSRTTNETLKLDLPLGVKVAITILRKIYLQSGAGRRENALFRGLSDQAQSKCSGVLDVLEKYGFVIKTRQRGNSVYLPTKDRGVSHRARDIVERPYNAEDPVLVPLKRL